MSITYADYIGATNGALETASASSNTRTRHIETEGAESPTFAELFQSSLTHTTLTCPKCGQTSALSDFQVTLNALGFAPGTGYATAGAPNTACSGIGSLYASSAYATSAYGSDLSRMNIEWPRGQNVSNWEQTIAISNVSVANGKISWTETGNRNSWPVVGDANCNANAWIIQKQTDGSYKASTWEYVRKGQTTKLTENLEGTDVISDPPKSGDRVGIMLAGITRNPRLRNIEARSNVVWITWP